MDWWRADGALPRFVADLLRGELTRLRPGGELPARPWTADLRLDEDGLAVDSLERLELAAALAEAVEMRRVGVEDALLARRTLGEWTMVAAASLERVSDALVFRTSGSTGTPRPCRHALADLVREADALAQLFGPVRRFVSLVPAHHIYGFLHGVLTPSRIGASVLDAQGLAPHEVVALLRRGDLVIGHPVLWSALARMGGLPPGVSGVTSTAPCPRETAEGVRAAGLDRLIEIYGSSETGGIGWCEGPDAAFRPFSWWGEETVAAAAPDHVEWETGGFRVAGRKDGVVQVGGVNVSPASVRRALLAHPLVADAAVRLMTPSEGQRLKAFIVPRDESLSAAELRAVLVPWIDQALTVPERPKGLSFGPALPRSPQGKLRDWPLA